MTKPPPLAAKAIPAFFGMTKKHDIKSVLVCRLVEREMQACWRGMQPCFAPFPPWGFFFFFRESLSSIPARKSSCRMIFRRVRKSTMSGFHCPPPPPPSRSSNESASAGGWMGDGHSGSRKVRQIIFVISRFRRNLNCG